MTATREAARLLYDSGLTEKYAVDFCLIFGVHLMSSTPEETLQRIHQKKRDLAARGPLPLSVEKNLYEWAKVALTYSSNSIEGNTLTEGETALILEKSTLVPGIGFTMAKLAKRSSCYFTEEIRKAKKEIFEWQ